MNRRSMSRAGLQARAGLLAAICGWGPAPAAAQELGLVVTDPIGQAVADLPIGVAGSGTSAWTDADGAVRVPLPDGATPGVWVRLVFTGASAADDFVWVSPSDRHVEVPVDRAPAIPVVVAERGAVELLAHPRSLAERVGAAAADAAADDEPADGAIIAARDDVASALRLAPSRVDEAIRAWGATAADPYDRGLALFYDARFAEAATAFTEALARFEDDPPGPARATVDAARFLGHALAAERRHAAAAAAFQRAVDRRPDEPRVLNGWARALLGAGHHAPADVAAQRALAAVRPPVGPDDPLVASIHYTMARVHQTSGRYALAAAAYERAVEIGERTLGASHLAVGSWLRGLGSVYMAQGRYSDAEPPSRRALAIAETWLGPDHPTVGVRMNSLAGLYSVVGRVAEAGELFARAVAIAEGALGPTDPTVGVRLNNLALNYQAQQRYDDAERLFARALEVIETALGPTHPQVAAVLNNYGMLLREIGRADEGAALEARAAATRPP